MSNNETGKKTKFVITSNRTTAEELKKIGLTFMSQMGSMWFFLNNNKLSFSDLPDVAYTDKLYF